MKTKVLEEVEVYVDSTLSKEGYTTSSIAVVEMDDKHPIGISLTDIDSDIGTYQFYKSDDDKIVVANYFDIDDEYRTFKSGDDEIFHNEFSLIVNLNHISELLDIAIEHKAHIYIGFDSDFINHSDLIKRHGWTDRKIKQNFGNVTIDELDNIRYYRMNEVLEIEKDSI